MADSLDMHMPKRPLTILRDDAYPAITYGNGYEAGNSDLKRHAALFV